MILTILINTIYIEIFENDDPFFRKIPASYINIKKVILE